MFIACLAIAYTGQGIPLSTVEAPHALPLQESIEIDDDDDILNSDETDIFSQYSDENTFEDDEDDSDSGSKEDGEMNDPIKDSSEDETMPEDETDEENIDYMGVEDQDQRKKREIDDKIDEIFDENHTIKMTLASCPE